MRAWLAAFRLHTLTASAAPVLVGSAVALRLGGLHWDMLVATLCGACAVQIGTNLTDEYADHQSTASAGKHLAAHKVIRRGLLSSTQVRRGAAYAFGLAAVFGAWVLAQAGWGLLPLFLGGLLVAWAYSAGPLPLGDWALGELLVFLAMGPGMVMGTAYAHTQAWSSQAFVFSLPVGALGAAILTSNNLRDLREDRANSRHTLATLLGLRGARALYVAWLAGSFAFPGVAWAAGWGGPWLLLPLLSLPLALRAASRILRQSQAAGLHPALRSTAALHGLFAALLALGCILEARLA